MIMTKAEKGDTLVLDDNDGSAKKLKQQLVKKEFYKILVTHATDTNRAKVNETIYELRTSRFLVFYNDMQMPI